MPFHFEVLNRIPPSSRNSKASNTCPVECCHYNNFRGSCTNHHAEDLRSSFQILKAILGPDPLGIHFLHRQVTTASTHFSRTSSTAPSSAAKKGEKRSRCKTSRPWLKAKHPTCLLKKSSALATSAKHQKGLSPTCSQCVPTNPNTHSAKKQLQSKAGAEKTSDRAVHFVLRLYIAVWDMVGLRPSSSRQRPANTNLPRRSSHQTRPATCSQLKWYCRCNMNQYDVIDCDRLFLTPKSKGREMRRHK